MLATQPTCGARRSKSHSKKSLVWILHKPRRDNKLNREKKKDSNLNKRKNKLNQKRRRNRSKKRRKLRKTVERQRR